MLVLSSVCPGPAGRDGRDGKCECDGYGYGSHHKHGYDHHDDSSSYEDSPYKHKFLHGVPYSSVSVASVGGGGAPGEFMRGCC